MEQTVEQVRVKYPIRQAREIVADGCRSYVAQLEAGVRDDQDPEVLALCREAIMEAEHAGIAALGNPHQRKLVQQAVSAESGYRLGYCSLEEYEQAYDRYRQHADRHTERFDAVVKKLAERGFDG